MKELSETLTVHLNFREEKKLFELTEICQDSTGGSDRLGIFGAVGSSQYQAFQVVKLGGTSATACPAMMRHLLLELRPHRVPGFGRASRLGRLLARR